MARGPRWGQTNTTPTAANNCATHNEIVPLGYLSIGGVGIGRTLAIIDLVHCNFFPPNSGRFAPSRAKTPFVRTLGGAREGGGNNEQ